MRTWLKLWSLIAAVGGLGAACTGQIGPLPEGTLGSGGSSNTGGTSSTEPTTSATGDTTDTSSGSGSAGGNAGCNPAPDDDLDGDGFSMSQGDCDDCNPLVNPNAVEIVTATGEGGAAPAPVDDDCDGTADNVAAPCDADLVIDDQDPLSAARAVELCKLSAGPSDWGVVSAAWVKVDGSPPPENAPQLANFHLGHGLLTGFGPNVKPRSGARLLALSSGAARQQGDPGFESPVGFDKDYAGPFPDGFPKAPRGCPDVLSPAPPADPTAVEITLRTPSNVTGFAFNINYNTFDWPDVCSDFNDFFIALLSPRPSNRIDGHLLFDSQENPMSVNTSLIDVCSCDGGPPCVLGGRTFACSLGTSELLGTGFESRAATSWLVTTVPVEPNQEIKIRFGAYDSGDHLFDSTGLIDNWRWLTDPIAVVSTQADRPPEAP